MRIKKNSDAAMNGSRDGKATESLIGIRVSTDGCATESKPYSEVNRSTDIVIGSILCSDLVLVDKFRCMLVDKFHSLPSNFQFLSKKGFPVEVAVEKELPIHQLIDSDLITVQKCFDVPRFGVKWFDGDFIGFIFINYNSSLVDVRKVVKSELSDVLHDEIEFEFRDNNRWPVLESQEMKLTMWDICYKDYIVICSRGSRKRKFSAAMVEDKSLPDPHRSSKLIKYSNKTSFQISNKTRRTSQLNPIVISYVHKEASIHARDLKRELVNLGHTVFLDVDDIPVGQDWQDTINMALNNCSAFVALVTPNYGQTTWTNREAKLADDKDKLIIPVSFLDKWPPDPLAIQFLTLQYIPWKTVDEFKIAKEKGESTEATDITFWDPGCVHRVAKEIKKICTGLELLTPDSSSTLEAAINEIDNANITSSQVSTLTQLDYEMDDTAIDIVINAHPEQKQFVERISAMLKKEQYKVWSSTDMEEAISCEREISCAQYDSQQSPSQCGFPSPFNSLNHSSSNDSITNMRRLMFSYSIEDGGQQYSQESSQENADAGLDIKCSISKMKTFKCKIKQSKLVILIISEAYCKSRTCVQQAFYCESRRKVIAIKHGTYLTQCKIFNLYPEEDMLSDDDNLLQTLRLKIASELSSGKESYKDRIEALASNLKSEITIDCCLYVIGGSRFMNRVAECFCHVLGSELARLSNLTLLTEGFFGASELVGRNFCEEREIRAKGKPRKIIHIVPQRDSKDFTTKARQKDDGTFDKIPYGRTVFCGNSVAERDDVVSSLFKICILIEGDTRSVRLAEKFSWNDCTVIPVIFSNERKTITKNILRDIPCGVSETDWQVLANDDCSPEDLAKAVKKIVCALLKKRCKEKT